MKEVCLLFFFFPLAFSQLVFVGDCLNPLIATIRTYSGFSVTFFNNYYYEYTVTLGPGEYCTHHCFHNFMVQYADDVGVFSTLTTTLLIFDTANGYCYDQGQLSAIYASETEFITNNGDRQGVDCGYQLYIANSFSSGGDGTYTVFSNEATKGISLFSFFALAVISLIL